MTVVPSQAGLERRAPTRARSRSAVARHNVSPSGSGLVHRLGLRYVATDSLTIRRLRRGRGFSYASRDGTPIRDSRTLQRLKSLAVPPAYEDVVYAEDPKAHIQAVGRDAAGRLQYRYHSDWQKVRELRKAARLARLAEAMPRIRQAISRSLSGGEPCRGFVLSAVIELVALSAIRPGNEEYARLHKTRGAVTLRKSNVVVQGDKVILRFRSKGGKQVLKEIVAPRLCKAISVLGALPGSRLFQYRTEDGRVRTASAREVNAFLRDIAGAKISLKDFRTLLASVNVLASLASQTPATSKRARRAQVLEAIRTAADELANTPTICAKSYVHGTVVAAFEAGVLENFAAVVRGSRSVAQREKVLAQLIVEAAA
jgi:DNA topoisomerase-1